MTLAVKNLPAWAADLRDMGSIPGSGRFHRLWGLPGGRHGNPLPHSCLENPMDRGAWRATVHGAERGGPTKMAYKTGTLLPLGLKAQKDL